MVRLWVRESKVWGPMNSRGVPGHYHLHVIAALYQQGRQHGGFIAGDTAGHAENHCFFRSKKFPSAAPTGLLFVKYSKFHRQSKESRPKKSLVFPQNAL